MIRDDRNNAENLGKSKTYGQCLRYAWLKPLKGLKVQVGSDNLFDINYHEHLTREAILTTTNLFDGDEVPAPGISCFAKVRYEF